MKEYQFLRMKEIEPKGWLKRQLEIQAEGLSGHLDEIWPDIRESAWTGGNRDGWERLPYWLDGFVPLAFLLRDEGMQQRAGRCVDAILSRQGEDGWICPSKDSERDVYDIWPLFLICKVLVGYYECTGDERIAGAVEKALFNCYTLLKENKIRLFNWGKFRWFECMISISWLYEMTGKKWLKDLARLLEKEGADYPSFLGKWKQPLNSWAFDRHIVNICMALKAEAVSYDLLDKGYTDAAEKLVGLLDEYNGTAVGLFTGDECLSGLSPIQGTELCAVVEQMYSYELLLAESGDEKWADRLEKITFNALPATCSEDMWTHQYDQAVNQIECVKFPGKPVFRTNGPEGYLFGLEPNFGCCTANFSQGWPKFARSTFLRTEDTIISAVFAPSAVTTQIEGKPVSVELDTEYPFKNTLRYIVTAPQETGFILKIRVPFWAKGMTVDGVPVKETGWYSIAGQWSGTRVVEVCFGREPEWEERPNGLKAVSYGPLVFSLPIAGEWEKLEYVRDGVERKFPYCDYQVHRRADWNYAFAAERPEVLENAVGAIPFSEKNPPVKLRMRMRKIDWGFEDGYETVCAKVPQSLSAVSDPEELFLIPYGCTTLRMTEMPKI